MSKIIIELGGSVHRLNKAIEIYKQNPDALILISSESNPRLCVDMLNKAGIPKDKYIFDFNAWDTVTNFTETYKFIRSKETKKLFIVTDRFHMKRSMTIAKNVYLFTGIDLIPCESLEGDLNRIESQDLIDACFWVSLIWKFTGYVPREKTYDTRMPGNIANKLIAQQIANVT